jgi:alkylation response protein AidB-like acyl-CoA dehydrogenase
MHFDYSPEQKSFRDRWRAYLAERMTPELRQELGPRPAEHCGPAYRRWIRMLGEDGWLGAGWPVEYGGKGLSFVEEYIFMDELRRAEAPIPLVTINTVGPTLMIFGSDGQKTDYLPRILRGEIHFAIGYTEPGAGTDLASLRTKAVRDGDHYIVNGQKIFTTGGHDADYFWLAVRTNPDAPKHKGITVLIVDSSLPGIKTTPIYTLDDGRTNAVYFEDVRVPVDAVVGAENEGWRLITTQLNHERVALGVSGKAETLLEETIAWAKETAAPEGGRMIDRPWVRQALAEVRARLHAVRILNWRMVWAMSRGGLTATDASVVKVFGSETFVWAFRTLLEVVGQAGALQPGSPGSILDGRIDLAYRWSLVLTFGGGVNEVQREIIATAGLGMPRAKR